MTCRRSEMLTETERRLVESAKQKPDMTEWSEAEREAVKRALDYDDENLDPLDDDDLDAPPERLCADCGRPWSDDVRDAPMLHDGSWRKLARKDELLCIECFEARAKARGIEITLGDLRPCPINAEWFEHYAAKPTPEVVEAWLKWARRAHESDELRREQFHNAADCVFGDGKPDPDGRLYRFARKIFRRHGG